jgi:hypothetical protein
MFWFRSGLHGIASISDWLTAGPSPVPDTSARLEDARDALLEALGDAGRRKRASLALRLENAPDVSTLWALRTEVMGIAGQVYGESEARRRVDQATACFEELLPAAAPRKRRLAAGASR